MVYCFLRKRLYFNKEMFEVYESKNVDDLIVTNLDGQSAFPAKLEAVKK